MSAAASQFPPLTQRPIANTICLFDVDGTLTPARRTVSPEMLALLQKLRTKVAIGFVGGSDLVKQQEQLGVNGLNVIDLFDYCFAENGLTAYKLGEVLPSNSFITWLGEEKYKKMANFILHYIADLDIPLKRGTFIEFRNGMINVSPIGRNASIQERHDFEAYDKIHNVRPDFVEALKKNFADYGLTYSVGGQISFDVFPTGWDKTYCLQHVEKEGVFSQIHFFGDKTYKGGNDYEIYEDPRTVGHSVTKPEDTIKILTELFEL
ncbi:eukaryotic phosphomannomutase [Choiromyces venosus 120613-1]|uniref:Phosphomannomutase n=1 Tax=Choiromyces venosus 120613-1 TaxID=1336337 RepID=A0A3N4K121_9PEZI|nr:eukaryotic phosphomannomutase [Choiromyces venosus 120613-1]